MIGFGAACSFKNGSRFDSSTCRSARLRLAAGAFCCSSRSIWVDRCSGERSSAELTSEMQIDRGPRLNYFWVDDMTCRSRMTSQFFLKQVAVRSTGAP